MVPTEPKAAVGELSAAADIAARVGFATTGLTPPVVIGQAEDRGDGPRIYVGGSAAPEKFRPEILDIWNGLELQEGGVFLVGGNLVVLGKDTDGLLAAAEQFASRAPFSFEDWWGSIFRICRAAGSLTGVTYLERV